ncbi:hypothetical protein RHSIM_Rhsim08G0011200 [Rhododendron simsii]|uniref:Cytochrome P450 n=1 Tax=Rhododendron simsii TaxID=118357 RepID=A0A834GI10_RHOSS|nr:hypothetical protein RHSIM_Rhsim08G0011200 [Rhododendron simsii]
MSQASTIPSTASHHRQLAPTRQTPPPILIPALPKTWPHNAPPTRLYPNPSRFLSQIHQTSLENAHDLHFCSRPPLPGPRRLSYDFLDVAFSPNSNSLRARRKLFVSKLFSAKRSKLFMRAREVGIDQIFAVAFGKSYGGKQFKSQKFQEVIRETIKMMDSFSAENFFPSFGWIVDLLSGHRGRLEKCFGDLDEYFERVIDDHLDLGRGKLEQKDQDFIDVLVGLLKDDESSDFRFKKKKKKKKKDHIKALILNPFIGGVDTIAVAMVWAMSEVIKNSHVMEKLQEEIRSGLGKKSTLDPNDLSTLKYLKMVVKETLRLHPPAPLLIPHETLRHCKLGNTDDGICPSIGMASSTVELILANLLYHFDWEMPCGMRREDISMEEEGGITAHKKAPLCLVPIR